MYLSVTIPNGRVYEDKRASSILYIISIQINNNTSKQDSTKMCCNNDKDLSLDH